MQGARIAVILPVGHRSDPGRSGSRRLGRGHAQTILVGLPEAAVRESTYRVDRATDISRFSRPRELFNTWSVYDDYTDLRGQETAKRALIIAAAGGRNLLMLGPPGSGKTVYISQHPTGDPDTPLQRDILFRRGKSPFSAIDPAFFLLIA